MNDTIQNLKTQETKLRHLVENSTALLYDFNDRFQKAITAQPGDNGMALRQFEADLKQFDVIKAASDWNSHVTTIPQSEPVGDTLVAAKQNTDTKRQAQQIRTPTA